VENTLKKFPLWAWVAVSVVLLDVAVVVALAGLNTDYKVYLRNILFSDIRSDAELPTPEALNLRLSQGFKKEADAASFLPYLNADKARSLAVLRDTPGTSDRALARAIADQLGDLSDGKICGLDSLGKVVFDTEKGLGCCSDYSKAWLFMPTTSA
jgi:hypothetical protein